MDLCGCSAQPDPGQIDPTESRHYESRPVDQAAFHFPRCGRTYPRSAVRTGIRHTLTEIDMRSTLKVKIDQDMRLPHPRRLQPVTGPPGGQRRPPDRTAAALQRRRPTRPRHRGLHHRRSDEPATDGPGHRRTRLRTHRRRRHHQTPRRDRIAGRRHITDRPFRLRSTTKTDLPRSVLDEADPDLVARTGERDH